MPGKTTNKFVDNLLDDVTLSCCAANSSSNKSTSTSTRIMSDQEEEDINDVDDDNDDDNNDDNNANDNNANDDDNNNSNSNEDKDETSDDVQAELDALDIDNDFNLSFIGDSNHNPNNKDEDDDDDDAVLIGKTETTMSPLTKKNKDVSNPAYAKQQLERDEVFSRHYHPTKHEEEVLTDVTTRLGANPRHALTKSSSSTVAKLLSGSDTDDPDYRGRSILLKRGLVRIGGEEKELLLFTHGFIITKKPLFIDNNSNKSKKNTNSSGGLRASVLGMVGMPISKFDFCHYYQDVAWVKDMWQLSFSKESYSIKIKSPNSQTNEIHFDAASHNEKAEWLQAWERVLLSNRSHAKLSKEERDSRMVGWQHALVQTSLYTAAVTGQAFFAPHHLKKVNVLDDCNGLAPLHYAALHNQVHVIEELLSDEHQQGDDDDVAAAADVELQDADGRTPMYYAERDNMVPAMKALRKGGAQASAALEREQHGALVEEARELEASKKHEHPPRRRSSWIGDAIAGLDEEKCQHTTKAGAQQQQARGAQSHMKDALSGIQDRGNKINDLGEKTDQLEDNAAEYQNLAAQVRQKLEKKNKGFQFLNPFSR